MARSLSKALLGSFFIAVLVFVLAVLVFVLAAPVAASNDEPRTTPVIAQVQSPDAPSNPYAGADGASPLDEVPVVPLIGATTALLVVLSVVAVRRGWLL